MKNSLLMAVGVLFAISTGPAQVDAHEYQLIIKGSDLIIQGRSALRSGNMTRAIRIYERALKRNLSLRDRQRALSDMCAALYFKREYDEAIYNCNKAIEITPNEWTNYNTRANVYLASENYEMALADYHYSLLLRPGSNIIERNIEIALERAADNGIEVTSEMTSGQLSDPDSLPDLGSIATSGQ